MTQQIFVNLPVTDLQRSIGFFTALGFTFNAQWTDEAATCMIIGDNIFVMLLSRERFQAFTPKPVADATKSTEVLLCLTRDSREAVDIMVRRAVAAGGNVHKHAEDLGFMYGHGFQDLDGHIWELIHLTPATVEPT
jgi:predicted lactoylglutathione lyase